MENIRNQNACGNCKHSAKITQESVFDGDKTTLCCAVKGLPSEKLNYHYRLEDWVEEFEISPYQICDLWEA
ncbi:hypothetical protein [Adonisia turfae]|uniref:hypothetical protein n=1 Tax=Adonisia turfae TaxID=2950184 RepID=UPI0013D7921F|nr:hypothetical protein [Adonisia turfae]